MRYWPVRYEMKASSSPPSLRTMLRKLKTVPKMSLASFWARVLLAFAAAAAAAGVCGGGCAAGGGAAGAAVGTPLTAVEGRVSAVEEAATCAAAAAEAGRAACWEGGSQFLVKTHSAGGGGGGQYRIGARRREGCQSKEARPGLLWRSKM